MSLLGSLAAMVENFVFKSTDDRPIGLKAFCEYSDEELLNHLTQPISPVPTLKPTFSKKALSKAAPAFAPMHSASYSFQEYKNPFTAQRARQF